MDDFDAASLLGRFQALVGDRLDSLHLLPVAAPSNALALPAMCAPPLSGTGLDAAVETFRATWLSGFSASPGPRYFGFVTGGTTPAALLGDWLASALDQNAMGSSDSISPQFEAEALRLFRELIDLPDDYVGSFVTGATMANFVGLSVARQWLGELHGVDIASQGLQALPSAPLVLSGAPHSSIYKAMAMAGIGRDNLRTIPLLPEREAIDPRELEAALLAHGEPCIVVANAGTVNSADFDDLRALVALRERHPFWLHVDAAFGGYAAASPKYRDLVDGLTGADSIAIDAHKWLNVPYDCAVQFSRRMDLQNQVFNNAASYLPSAYSPTNFVHMTPENSRRLRALPVWFTLQAYGKFGYAAMIERHCDLAQSLASWIDADPGFELLSKPRLNGFCFVLRTEEGRAGQPLHAAYLKRLADDGRVFITLSQYLGVPAIRVSISNWRTSEADIDIVWDAMRELHPRASHSGAHRAPMV